MKTQLAAKTQLVGRGEGFKKRFKSSISKRSNTMNAHNPSYRILARGLSAIFALILMVGVVFGQNIRNGGTFINSSPMSVKNFNNAKNGTGGVLKNYSSITLTGGGSFFNRDSVTSQATGTGIFYNYGSGLNATVGTLVGAYTFDNSNGKTIRFT